MVSLASRRCREAMNAYQLVLVVFGTPFVGAFLSPPVHVSGAPPGYRCSTHMAALDFSASPVNTAETLQRTTNISLQGTGQKKKLALLGSTVSPGNMCGTVDIEYGLHNQRRVGLSD